MRFFNSIKTSVLDSINSSWSMRHEINEAIKSGRVNEFNSLILKSGDSLGYIQEYIDQIAKYKHWAMLETLSQMLDKMDLHYDYLFGSSPWDQIKWNHEFALLDVSAVSGVITLISRVRESNGLPSSSEVNKVSLLAELLNAGDDDDKLRAIFNKARTSGAAVSKESDLSLLGDVAEQSASTMTSLPGDVDVESNKGVKGVELKSLPRTSKYSVAGGASVFKGVLPSQRNAAPEADFDSESRPPSR